MGSGAVLRWEMKDDGAGCVQEMIMDCTRSERLASECDVHYCRPPRVDTIDTDNVIITRSMLMHACFQTYKDILRSNQLLWQASEDGTDNSHG
jgi:hypothetical protein